MRKAGHSRGFTILELSIVMVIIAFIIGGIMVGQNMVRQSQIMSAMTDARSYIAAVQSFQQKYSALPGDMANATTYWGNSGGSSGTNYTTDCYTVTTGTGTQTCNGNGDGQIFGGYLAASNTYANESLRVWQHLANAQFISGNYNGLAGGAGALDAISGSNVPASRIDGAGFSLVWFGIASTALSNDTNVYDGSYGHVILLGAHNSNNVASAAAMTAAEAFAIDQKYDDALPSTGNITTWKPAFLANCANSSTPPAYKTTSSTGLQCALIFTTGF